MFILGGLPSVLEFQKNVVYCLSGFNNCHLFFIKNIQMNKLLLFALCTLLLSNCTPDDPCDSQVCQNASTCIEGVCQCLPQYMGDQCQFESIPTSMEIIGIAETKRPDRKPDGSTWDSFFQPDLVYLIVQESTGAILFQSEEATNISSSEKYIVDMQLTVDASERYSLFFVDVDEGILQGKNDVMGSVSFQPYLPGENFPRNVVFENDTIGAALILLYHF